MRELKGIGSIEEKVGDRASKGDISRGGGNIFSWLGHPQALARQLGSYGSHRH